jgi:hypothetical protein
MTTAFDALLAPLSDALEKIGNSVDAKTKSKKLFFADFVRSLLFGFSIQVPSLRRLILELETNQDAQALNLPAFKKSTLSDGFQRFSVKYFDYLYKILLAQAELRPISDETLQKIGMLRAIDGSIFPVMKTMDWAAFRRKRKALKIHLELSINSLCVTNYLIGTGNSNERKALLDMIEIAVTYICDRGYFSFDVVNTIHKFGAFFIFRLKKNYKIELIERLELTGTIPDCFLNLTDELVQFASNPLKTDAAIFRIVRFQIQKTHFIICTNRRDLTTLEIILCYAYRWQIELFFKYLKRSLGAIHLFSNTRNGAKVYLILMLIFALLQLIMQQNCQKIVNNSVKQEGGFAIAETHKIENCQIAADWVAQLGIKFKKVHKISADWLTFLKNSIAQIFDYQTIEYFATL